jgi:hypothetical protein
MWTLTSVDWSVRLVARSWFNLITRYWFKHSNSGRDPNCFWVAQTLNVLFLPEIWFSSQSWCCNNRRSRKKGHKQETVCELWYLLKLLMSSELAASGGGGGGGELFSKICLTLKTSCGHRPLRSLGIGGRRWAHPRLRSELANPCWLLDCCSILKLVVFINRLYKLVINWQNNKWLAITYRIS